MVSSFAISKKKKKTFAITLGVFFTSWRNALRPPAPYTGESPSELPRLATYRREQTQGKQGRRTGGWHAPDLSYATPYNLRRRLAPSLLEHLAKMKRSAERGKNDRILSCLVSYLDLRAGSKKSGGQNQWS